MRCPKCHYLSFEPEPRCRNCGYDLTFEAGDLLVQSAEPTGDAVPDLDLSLREPPQTADTGATSQEVPASRSRRETSEHLPTSPANDLPIELPLFLQDLADRDAPSIEAAPSRTETPPALQQDDASDPELDTPLVRVPPAPRAPLSVRRPTPGPGRVREKYQRPVEKRQTERRERDLLDTVELEKVPLMGAPTETVPLARGIPAASASAFRSMSADVSSAGAARRLEAAIVDALFIGSINLTIVWLTLQRCDLTFSQLGSLPIAPVAAMLLLLDSLYLLMFTVTNGQTIGKMAAGIRVVRASDAAEAPDRVTLKQAIVRALVTFPSVLTLGAGFLPALVGDGLAVHDRIAHTRVIRA